jgi:ferredoxin/flavodoxin---NADP+ reductase
LTQPTRFRFPLLVQTELNATVLAREDLSETVFLLRVQPDGVPAPPFEPGQFVQVGLPLPTPARDGSGELRIRLQKRSYSLASAPGDPRGLELCLAHVAQGRLTPALRKLAPGARLFVDPNPLGGFTLEGIPPERDLVLVATGTGVAPYVSMRRAYAGKGRWRRMAILHGVREVADLCYRQELEQAARSDPSFVYLPLVSRESDPARWSGSKGRVQQLLESARLQELARIELSPQGCHVLLCGNPAMIDETRALLEQRGFAPDTYEKQGGLRFERYW